MSEPQRIVAVYDADGGLIGETRYVLGKLLGRAHCSLCDITHSPVRRKQEWDELTASLGTPLIAVHRNEQDEETRAVTAVSGLPAVIGFHDAGAELLIGPEELHRLDGSVSRFAELLRQRCERPAESPPRRRGRRD